MNKYNIEDLSDRYKYVVERMINQGVLETNIDGTFNASEEMLELFLLLGRLGLI